MQIFTFIAFLFMHIFIFKIGFVFSYLVFSFVFSYLVFSFVFSYLVFSFVFSYLVFERIFFDIRLEYK